MRVCVIGGGAAGLGAAYFLEQAGHKDVVVFEKEPQVGGKCRTLMLDGCAYDMGAVEVTQEYRTVLSLVERLDVPLSTVPGGRVLDVATGLSKSLMALYDGASKIAFAAQVAKFMLTLRGLSDFLDRPGFANVPDELKGISFQAWLRREGMELLERFFWMPLTCYGYGALDRIPAIYALKFATVMPFHVLARRFDLHELLPDEYHLLEPFVHRPTFGMQSLMQKVADTLTTPPILNARIREVVRAHGEVRVRYRIGDDDTDREQVFDKLIVSVPQTVANLSTFLDLTPAERKLFAPVSTIPYYTSLTRPKTFDYKVYYTLANGEQLGPQPLPDVKMFVRSWPQATGTVFYTCAEPGDELPLAGGERSVEGLVTKAIRVARQQPDEAIQSVGWSYFPQVPQASIDAGYYDALEAAQGQGGTYWTGGLLAFELVEKVMEYSKSLVDRCFTAPSSER